APGAAGGRALDERPRCPRSEGPLRREPHAGDRGRGPGLGHGGGDREPAAQRIRRAPRNPGALSEPERSTLARWLFRLRVEEAIALAFLLPTTYLTAAANVYAREAGVLGDRHPGGIARLVVAAFALGVLAAALWLRPKSPVVQLLRDVLPFLVRILIYTNLHDTIGFVNPRDVHHELIAMDRALFGVEPCLWAERFITP